MTRIKLCGLRRVCEVEWANELRPDYVGFVLSPGYRRSVTPETARVMKAALSPSVRAVGVFTGEKPETVARLLNDGLIDAAQLHAGEDEAYIARLHVLTDRPLIKAFRVRSADDVRAAGRIHTDMVLLDSGTGTGKAFDWTLLAAANRPYILAGGLDPERVGAATAALRPWGVDVSSGIETDGVKDRAKMAAFVTAVRGADGESG